MACGCVELGSGAVQALGLVAGGKVALERSWRAVAEVRFLLREGRLVSFLLGWVLVLGRLCLSLAGWAILVWGGLVFDLEEAYLLILWVEMHMGHAYQKVVHFDLT